MEMENAKQRLAEAESDEARWAGELATARAQGLGQNRISFCLREVRDSKLEILEATRAVQRLLNRQNARMEHALDLLRARQANEA